MSKEAKSYVSTGLSDATQVVGLRNFKFIRQLIFTLSSVIGKRFFLSFPLFALAEYHLAHQVQTTRMVDLEKAFESSNQHKKYWTTVHYALINQIILIVGLILFGFVAFVLFLIGLRLDNYFGFEQYYILYFLQIILGLIFLVFLIQRNLYFSSVVYLIQSSETPELSELLYQNRLLMKDSNKLKLLKIHTYYIFRILGAALIYGLILLALFQVLIYSLFILVSAVFAFIWLKSLPKLVFAHKISTTLFFNDLVKEAAFISLTDKENYEAFSDRVRKEDIIFQLFEEITLDNKQSETTTSETGAK